MVYRDQEIQELTNIFSGRLPSLTRIALRMVGNAEDAEDAVQDAFLSAYAQLDQFRGQAKISTWLTTIVINAARMKVRARPREVHVPLDQENREQDHRPLSDVVPDTHGVAAVSARSAALFSGLEAKHESARATLESGTRQQKRARVRQEVNYGSL